jgi:hypothetical protein
MPRSSWIEACPREELEIKAEKIGKRIQIIDSTVEQTGLAINSFTDQ